SIPAAPYGTTAIVVGNTLYVMGGDDSGTSTSNVYHATINGSGQLRNFGSGTVHLDSDRYEVALAVAGNWLYVIGGHNNGSLTSVEGAPILPDGSLGSFAPAGTLSVAREGPVCAAISDWLYVAGGAGRTTVERARINRDGSLGSFAIVPGVALTVERA